MPTNELPGWRHVASGKVRDLYELDVPDPTELLLVASDRISAFDVILEPGIPGKGALLTRLSRWWFARLGVPNHLAADESAIPETLRDRSMLVRRLRMHPVECVVRGYLTGSGLSEYLDTGAVCGVRLPAGLVNGDRLPEPVFTPAYKAPAGEHDENIDFDRVVELVGGPVAEGLRARSLEVFRTADAVTASKGLLLADTKFEFGDDPETGALVLADEVLTPDSSRYWDGAAYAAGRRGVSFDKQDVRDWLAAHWDREGPAPRLPDDLVARTALRYAELLRILAE